VPEVLARDRIIGRALCSLCLVLEGLLGRASSLLGAHAAIDDMRWLHARGIGARLRVATRRCRSPPCNAGVASVRSGRDVIRVARGTVAPDPRVLCDLCARRGGVRHA
jgi:hypothetical protein